MKESAVSKRGPARVSVARSEIPPSASRRCNLNGKPRGGRLNNGGTREPLYTPQLAAEICRRISVGQTLTAICRDPALGVTEAAVRHWVAADRDGFASAYARARMIQTEAWADQLVDIAENGDLEPNDRRVRIDTKRWLMGQLHPRQRGDKTVIGGDPDRPV